MSGGFNDYYYYHLNDKSAKQEVTIGEYTTDADSILVEENEYGDAVSVFICNGTYIKSPFYKDEYLFKSETPKTLGYKLNGVNMVEISTDKVLNDPDNLRTAFTEEDLKDLTIYVGTSSKGAIFNTNIVNTAKSGGYVYFGDEPIVEGTEKETSGSDNKEENKGNHGGGGGGGGGGAVAPKPPVEDDNETEDVTPDVPVEPDIPVTPVVPAYDDVDEDDWYFSYVEELSGEGIVSGDGTGYFGPNDNITREQFLKMLLLAVGAEFDNAENIFGDVLDDGWYKDYVLTAKKLGIVNGISDDEFGIGTNITRQDMAVMIARTMEKFKIQPEKKNVVSFDDDDKISDYAKESVKLMKSIGLIEGYNNEYRPSDNLTKAEAAKVIAGILGYVEN